MEVFMWNGGSGNMLPVSYFLDRRCLSQVGQKTGSLPTSGGPCDVKIFFKILQFALPVKDLELPGMALLASDGHQVAAFHDYFIEGAGLWLFGWTLLVYGLAAGSVRLR